MRERERERRERERERERERITSCFYVRLNFYTVSNTGTLSSKL